MGYGVALFGRCFTGTPNAGLGLSNGDLRDWRLGWRLNSAAPERRTRPHLRTRSAIIESNSSVGMIIIRIYSALGAFTGRCGLRVDASRNEAVSLEIILGT